MQQYALLRLTKYKQRGDMALEQAIEARIAQGYTAPRALRKDAVRAIAVALSGSHQRMKQIEAHPALFEPWKKANYQFVCEEFGPQNIVRFVVCQDQKTPYIHCVFVPITQEGRLSAKEYMQGRACLEGYLDRYGRRMERFGLERVTTQKRLQDYKKQAEQDYRHEIDQALKRVKEEVNLVQHIASMGYQLNKAKSCKRYAVLEQEGDKLIVSTRPNHHGHWVYMSAVNDRDRGTIVDFMLHRGHPYKAICRLSSAHLDQGVLVAVSQSGEVIEDETLQYKLSKGSLARDLGKAEVTYLERRKVDERSYKCYLGECMALGGNKAVFGLYQQVDSQGGGRLCSTISYDYDQYGQSRQYFQAGLPRGLSLLRDAEPRVQRLVVCESPIDALSYKQQQGLGAGVMYVSTCGSLTHRLRAELRGLLAGAHAYGQEVILAFDRDEAGRKMNQEMAGICQTLQVRYRVHLPPHGKDWNEALNRA